MAEPGRDTTPDPKITEWARQEPSGREATPEQHDELCESEFITGPMAWSPCGCAERAGRESDAPEWTL